MPPASSERCMTETRLHASLRAVCTDLSARATRFALVGGLAVSARTEPRFTRDLDLAVAVVNDQEAESLIRSLRAHRYSIEALVEHEAAARLATVRLIPPSEYSLFVDLLFASSGIEAEIVAAAEPLEMIEGLVVPVATVAHLIATKVLSRDDDHRPQDHADLIALLRHAREPDIIAARNALRMIEARGFNRGRDLLSQFDAALNL